MTKDIATFTVEVAGEHYEVSRFESILREALEEYDLEGEVVSCQSPMAVGIGLSVDAQSIDRNCTPLPERPRTDRTPDIKAN